VPLSVSEQQLSAPPNNDELQLQASGGNCRKQHIKCVGLESQIILQFRLRRLNRGTIVVGITTGSILNDRACTLVLEDNVDVKNLKKNAVETLSTYKAYHESLGPRLERIFSQLNNQL